MWEKCVLILFQKVFIYIYIDIKEASDAKTQIQYNCSIILEQ